MSAPRTQKRASANAGRTTARRGSASRASSSRSRATTSRTRTGSRASAPARRARAKHSKVASLVIIAAILVGAWTVYPVLKLQYEHQRELSTLESELESLKARNGELRQEVDELKTPEGVEQIARETLGFVKPGEQAYVVTGGTAEETTATAEPDDGTVWQGVLDTLFGFE